MTDYTDLVKRLRSIPQRIKTGVFVCLSNEFPVCREAADAIEALQGLVERYESEKDVHEYEQKTLWACVEGQGKRIAELEEQLETADNTSIAMRDMLIEKLDTRIRELEAALKPFADASDLHLGSDDMSIAFRIIIGNLRQARKVLGEKE